jgi:excisionase family DNA binding protein
MAKGQERRSSGVLTTSQVARLCHVTANTVANWIDAGRLPAYRTPGGHRRVRQSDLRSFMESNGFPLPEEEKEGHEARRFLIVDDDPQVTRILRDFLSLLDPEAEISVAGDGFEAGRLCSEENPDAVLLDIRMPGMDGIEVCRRIKSDPRHGHTAVVAMTGYPSEETTRLIVEAGAVDCIAKPIDLGHLGGLLERITGAGSAH